MWQFTALYIRPNPRLYNWNPFLLSVGNLLHSSVRSEYWICDMLLHGVIRHCKSFYLAIDSVSGNYLSVERCVYGLFMVRFLFCLTDYHKSLQSNNFQISNNIFDNNCAIVNSNVKQLRDACTHEMCTPLSLVVNHYLGLIVVSTIVVNPKKASYIDTFLYVVLLLILVPCHCSLLLKCETPSAFRPSSPWR